MGEALLRTDKDFAAVYERYVRMVYRVCFLHVKNAADAEDMTQNTFIRLLEHKKAFDSEEHRKAWLLVTATNLCRDFLRHWWRRRVPMDSLPERGENMPDPDDTLAQVLALPTRIKTTVYLYYYEGYTTVEIAGLLHKKEATVRGYLHTGRKQLRRKLTQENEERMQDR